MVPLCKVLAVRVECSAGWLIDISVVIDRISLDSILYLHPVQGPS